MTATRVLIEMLGEVALLMWGMHMVAGGVQRAFGTGLRRVLGIGLRNRLTAFLSGIGVTAALQSSTATALMVTSFSGSGAVDLVPALAVMLGANVGTALITQALSFDIAYVFPALIAAGVFTYRNTRVSQLRDTAKAAIGIGLMLLSLHLLVHTMAPVESSATLKAVLASITTEPLLAMGAAALFAWAAHSSVASILLIASLARAGLTSPDATVAMVLGCNLGSALNPLVDALGNDPARLRVPFGNLVNRLGGCVLVLPVLDPVARAVMSVDPSPARLAATVHFVFNIAMAALFIGLLPALAAALRKALPDRAASDPGAALYLDRSALSTPSVALANASREVLRMVDIVETMMRGSQSAFHRDDREKIAAIGGMDDVLDRLYVSVQGYIGLVSHETLSTAEAKRIDETVALAINLEHIGDIVEKNLMEMAQKRIEKGLRLSSNSLAIIAEMHGRLLDNLRLAVAVYMSRDVEAARRLVADKEQFRQIEQAATERHFQEMRSGHVETIRTSSLELDITRDLKRIEAHIAATAYSLLKSSGELRPSRLRVVPDARSA